MFRTSATAAAFATAAWLALALPGGAAHAAAHAAAPAASNPQQNRMAACNKDAGERKGDERKAFMKDCLSNKKVTQQEKMKNCNKEATGKTGEERKAFMKSCLSS